MERYLLSDSGCSLCTSMAHQVEDASDGKLTARSLRDPEVRAVLDEVRPGWRWEPMLLEVDGERRRVYAGVGLRLRLVQVLGLWRAFTLARIVQQAAIFQPGRRGVLRLAGGLLAGLTLSGWMSGSVEAGDGPETGSTTHVYLPLVQRSPFVADIYHREAEQAVQLVAQSNQFVELRRKHNLQTDAIPSRLRRVVTMDGAVYYAAGRWAVALMGERDGLRLYEVLVGTRDESPELEENLLVAFVNVQQAAVLEVFRLQISSLVDTRQLKREVTGYRLSLETVAGQKLEAVTPDGQIDPRQLPVVSAAEWNWCAFWAGMLCWTGGLLACTVQCGAICFVTAGIACPACSAICAFLFAGICTQSGNNCP